MSVLRHGLPDHRADSAATRRRDALRLSVFSACRSRIRMRSTPPKQPRRRARRENSGRCTTRCSSIRKCSTIARSRSMRRRSSSTWRASRRSSREGVYADRVHQDFETGVRSGVNGTPTFFVNGMRYDGQWINEGRVRRRAIARVVAMAHNGAPTAASSIGAPYSRPGELHLVCCACRRPSSRRGAADAPSRQIRFLPSPFTSPAAASPA